MKLTWKIRECYLANDTFLEDLPMCFISQELPVVMQYATVNDKSLVREKFTGFHPNVGKAFAVFSSSV